MAVNAGMCARELAAVHSSVQVSVDSCTGHSLDSCTFSLTFRAQKWVRTSPNVTVRMSSSFWRKEGPSSFYKLRNRSKIPRSYASKSRRRRQVNLSYLQNSCRLRYGLSNALTVFFCVPDTRFGWRRGLVGHASIVNVPYRTDATLTVPYIACQICRTRVPYHTAM